MNSHCFSLISSLSLAFFLFSAQPAPLIAQDGAEKTDSSEDLSGPENSGEVDVLLKRLESLEDKLRNEGSGDDELKQRYRDLEKEYIKLLNDNAQKNAKLKEAEKAASAASAKEKPEAFSKEQNIDKEMLDEFMSEYYFDVNMDMDEEKEKKSETPEEAQKPAQEKEEKKETQPEESYTPPARYVQEPAGLPALKEEQKKTYTPASGDAQTAQREMLKAQKLFYKKRYSEALKAVNRSLSLQETASAYALMGSVFYAMDDLPGAVESWEKALELDPGMYEVRDALSRYRYGRE
jgi:tetratricopeptide (TPR) repeat protein